MVSVNLIANTDCELPMISSAGGQERRESSSG